MVSAEMQHDVVQFQKYVGFRLSSSACHVIAAGVKLCNILKDVGAKSWWNVTQNYSEKL